jgi:hypothetical protein
MAEHVAECGEMKFKHNFCGATSWKTDKGTEIFDVLTAAKISTVLSWVVTPHGLLGRYHRFGGIQSSISRMKIEETVEAVFPKRQCPPTTPYSVITQENIMDQHVGR